MKRLFPVLVVLFLGYLGFALAIPIFPPLFLDPTHSFLPLSTDTTTRRILLGVLFAMYPLGQFIGAPVLGKLSDKYGRKKLLLTSLLGTIPMYVGCALSVIYRLPVLLYISHILCGLLEGNVTIAQAAISDISECERTKIKHFAWMISLSSSAFFFGPLIGGHLANSKLISWFHYDTPFWCAAILVLIGFFIVWHLFIDTHTGNPKTKIHPFEILTSFADSFRIKRLRTLFSANLCFFFAMFMFLNFFSAYLVSSFGFNVSQLGEASAYLSIFIIASPFLFTVLAKYFSTAQVAIAGSLLMGLALIIFVIPSSPHSLFFTLIPMGFCVAIGFAYPAIMVSSMVSKTAQGHILGINTSIQVFAEAITALIGGLLLAFHSSLPFWVGAAMAILGGVLLFIREKNQN